VSEGHQHNRSRLKNRRHSHGQGLARHIAHLAAEWTGIRAAGVQPQTHAVGPQFEIASRLVEPDVTVSSDAQQLEIDAAKAGNETFEAGALALSVARAAVEEVHVIWPHVDMAKQMLLHKRAETSWI